MLVAVPLSLLAGQQVVQTVTNQVQQSEGGLTQEGGIATVETLRPRPRPINNILPAARPDRRDFSFQNGRFVVRET